MSSIISKPRDRAGWHYLETSRERYDLGTREIDVVASLSSCPVKINEAWSDGADDAVGMHFCIFAILERSDVRTEAAGGNHTVLMWIVGTWRDCVLTSLRSKYAGKAEFWVNLGSRRSYTASPLLAGTTADLLCHVPEWWRLTFRFRKLAFGLSAEALAHLTLRLKRTKHKLYAQLATPQVQTMFKDRIQIPVLLKSIILLWTDFSASDEHKIQAPILRFAKNHFASSTEHYSPRWLHLLAPITEAVRREREMLLGTQGMERLTTDPNFHTLSQRTFQTPFAKRRTVFPNNSRLATPRRQPRASSSLRLIIFNASINIEIPHGVTLAQRPPPILQIFKPDGFRWLR
ncbi:uncharacterized protein BDR25DRAFT_395198 [Lindgomyces ingoldianus]|uniref:Uncharacterized protein n=1 Tax=Lindgomyces ingoldianus TaxID=673940 RepID=A0ACB6QLD0_9PLEO|nr:uncharacterized protein BDR25DRAFT_395198 [Lindgomyces ingoldianus]KAF2467748.1 hypothetical protein BDR25DRAFT_395198 [Lindgomyces ingoldianus]